MKNIQSFTGQLRSDVLKCFPCVKIGVRGHPQKHHQLQFGLSSSNPAFYDSFYRIIFFQRYQNDLFLFLNLPGIIFNKYYLMNQFYVGDNNEFIEAGYAPTGRATCKACKKKIDMGEIRLSYNVDSGNFSYTHWYHFKCFELKPKFKDIDAEQEIYQIDQLDGNETDYGMVVDYINQEKERLKRGQKKVKPVPSSQNDDKDKDKNQGASHGGKKEAKEQKKDESDAENKDSLDQDYEGSKKRKKKARKQIKEESVVPAAPAYTPEQQKKYQELISKFDTCSAETLKQMLAKNSQSKTGTKAELIDKCADGIILGQIPHCPSCGGGRPKFNKDTATYKCSGYMDDDKFKNCHKTFTMDQIQRIKWIE